MRKIVGFVTVLLTASSLSAQSHDAHPSAGKEATGSISGHVFCGDTNLPARFASVMLQPAYEAVSTPPKSSSAEERKQPTVAVSQTTIDGSFIIHDVKPGRYYVIVEMSGYLSPIPQLTREQLNKPDDAAAALIARLLGSVTVTANHTATAEVRLQRGGSISGTVRFDDGSPDGGADIGLLRRGKDGKWERFSVGIVPATFNRMAADDQGHYRVSGVPAGEYLVYTMISMNELQISPLFGEQSGMSARDVYHLSVFTGGAVRSKDAKSVKLQEGESIDLIDIEIPASKMHSVSGNVVDASGKAVNAAKVSLIYPDDNVSLVSTDVSPDDNGFHFLFVPEGEYTLKITDAKDVSRQEILNPPGTFPPSFTKETAIREYREASQPLIVQGEVSGFSATVKAKETKLASSDPQ